MKYDKLTAQLQSILDVSLPLVSNLANASAVLNQMGNLNWCGFYLVRQQNLVLGPFQGEPACTVIPCGKGVCGTAMQQQRTVVVADVNAFPGHIACSTASKSEIVTPIFKNGNVVAVIDLDAPVFSRFATEEQQFLEHCAQILAPLF